VSWDNPTDGEVIGTDLLKELEEKMEKIKHNLKTTSERRKRFVEKKKKFIDFKVGEHVFLKLKSKRSFLILGSFPKLAARYCGPFEILENIGLVAYLLSFLASMRVNNVFHVSLLKKYVSDPNHIIDWTMIQEEHEGDFRVEPICILDWKVKVLRKKSIRILKVQWT
jgi:hypothetical protein